MKLREPANIRCSTCSIGDLCLAKDQSPEALAWLDNAITYYKVFEVGEHLFNKGDASEYVFAIRAGAGKVYQVSKDGDEFIRDFFTSGDILGLRYAQYKNYACNAIATEKTFACLIPIKLIREPEPFLSNRLLSLMSQKLIHQEPYQHMTSAKKRVAAFFLTLINKARSNGTKEEIIVQPSNLDISRKIGIANETLSRILSEFAESKLLFIKNHVVQQYDQEKLDALIGYDLETYFCEE